MRYSKNFYPIPPGSTIKELIDDRLISQKEFAVRMDMSEKHLSKLIKGSVPLTRDIAMKLEDALGIDKSVWLGMEQSYQEEAANARFENSLENDELAIKNNEYKSLCNLNWIREAKSKTIKVRYLRQFLEVSKLNKIYSGILKKVYFKCIPTTRENSLIRACFAQKVILEGRRIEAKRINIDRIKKNLNKLKEYSLLDPLTSINKIKLDLLKSGVVLVILESPEGLFIDGCVVNKGKKLLLGVAIRNNDLGRFYESLFHELGHIVLGHINKEYEESFDEECRNFSLSVFLDGNYKLRELLPSINKDILINFSKEHKINMNTLIMLLRKNNMIKYDEYKELEVSFDFNEVYDKWYNVDVRRKRNYMDTSSKKIDFNKDFDFESKSCVHCFLNDDKLIFTEYSRYVGPITMQALPSGGIQSLFHGVLIINVKNGYLGVTRLIYKGESYTSAEFIDLMELKNINLMNEVLL